jgi:hypothetical protein
MPAHGVGMGVDHVTVYRWVQRVHAAAVRVFLGQALSVRAVSPAGARGWGDYQPWPRLLDQASRVQPANDPAKICHASTDFATRLSTR